MNEPNTPANSHLSADRRGDSAPPDKLLLFNNPILNRIIVLVLLACLSITCPVSGVYADDSTEANGENPFGLEMCHDKKLRVAFLCDPDWDYQLVEDGLLVIMSRDPIVTITFARIDSEITHLPKLNKSVLSKKNLYEKGFRRDLMQINGRDVIIVRAFAKKDASRRVLDHFFMRDEKLFGVLFSVTPKDKWDEFKFKIKAVADSISFPEDTADSDL